MNIWFVEKLLGNFRLETAISLYDTSKMLHNFLQVSDSNDNMGEVSSTKDVNINIDYNEEVHVTGAIFSSKDVIFMVVIVNLFICIFH